MKKDDTKNLKLKEYKKIWSKFCFLDESGSLNRKTTPFFTIGLIKCSQPYYLYSKLMYMRNKLNFHDEMKFNKLSQKNIGFAKLAIEEFLDTRSIYFYSYTIDKEGNYFQKNFDDNPWIAYEQISIRLAKAALSESEILILLADWVTVPKDVRYEITVKNKINEDTQRLAMAGVCRIDSKSNNLLQITDLFIGAINYDLKLSTGITTKGDKNKKEFVKFLKNNLGTESFVNGFRNRKFNIFVDKDVKQRLQKKEKEPSS